MEDVVVAPYLWGERVVVDDLVVFVSPLDDFRMVPDGLRRIDVRVVRHVGAGKVGIDVQVVNVGITGIRRGIRPIRLFNLRSEVKVVRVINRGRFMATGNTVDYVP